MKRLSFIFAALFVSIVLNSQDIDNENLAVTHGPYLQNLSGTGVTIVWTTNRPAIPGISLSGPEGSTRFIRNSHDGIIDGGGTLHKVRVEGLEPGKTYKYILSSVQVMKYQAYKIYYGDTLSGRPVSFITPSSNSEQVNFVVVNDVHQNSGKFASYLKNVKEFSPEFYFFNGDMMDFVQSENEMFPSFIDTAVFYFAKQKEFVYARGNHETRGFAARGLRNYFELRSGRYYCSFDRGPVHFIVLDCGEDKTDDNRYYYGLADYDRYRMEELEWLKNEVKTDAFRNASKRIVIVHMPIIKEEVAGHGMQFLADNFGPVLQSAGINLMLSAHTHRNTWYETAKSGFSYPVLVNSANSFVEIHADRKEIKATVKDMTGKVINSYSIK
ncbi:MAG TPA: FN3 domain-containing metallophosphoesterase family protein [Bacteroidales bacterium]|nr:FN3 domain-containing metallophosphoesterase family protein [Bacteroidales bacterium]